MDTSNQRIDYNQDSLSIHEVKSCPFAQFETWFNECKKHNIKEPYAMAIATSINNKAHVRTVLMRQFDKKGICFYTNYDSAKGHQIESSNFGEALFFWQDLERQVRINGFIEKVSAQQSDEYFQKRPQSSQISAIISPQSQIIPSREYLEQKYDEYKNSHDAPYSRPQNWGGYILIPEYFEFWQGRASRLHDRVIYRKINKNWQIDRLAP